MTDDLFALAASLGFGDLQIPARRSDRPSGHPLAGGPVPIVPVVRARDEGRAVGAGGAATFWLPDVRVPLVFDAGSGELAMTNPPPPPTGPGSPPPPPPPPLVERVSRMREPIRLGEGPQYDALPPPGWCVPGCPVDCCS